MADTPTLRDDIFDQIFRESVVEFQRLENIGQGQKEAAAKVVRGVVFTAIQLVVILAAVLVGYFMDSGGVKFILLAFFAGILLTTEFAGLRNIIGGIKDARALNVSADEYPAKSSEPPPKFTAHQAYTIAAFLKVKEGHPGLNRWMVDLRQRIDKALAEEKSPAA